MLEVLVFFQTDTFSGVSLTNEHVLWRLIEEFLLK